MVPGHARLRLRLVAATLILILMIALPLMLSVAMIIYMDRKVWAAMALRRGPNVVGPFGLLQSFATAQGLPQETIIPSSANRGLFLLAPIITFTLALIAWAVIPFGPDMALSNINVGLLYILAVSSLSVYGVIIAGWASASNIPSTRASRAAQMVSYEGLGRLRADRDHPVVRHLQLGGIIDAQRSHVGLLNGFGFNPCCSR
jgi:NADH-quinone oxidoreductase subunit H